MLLIVLELNNLLAVSAGLWFHETLVFMPSKLTFFKLYFAILTWYFCMSLLIMLLFFCFSNEVTTYLTDVVISCTTYFMYSKFWHFYWFFACWAYFSGLRLCWYLVIVHNFKNKLLISKFNYYFPNSKSSLKFL